MKIGIDTFCCDHGRSGLGSYLQSFVKNIRADLPHQCVLFGSELDRYTYCDDDRLGYEAVAIADSLFAERLWHFFRINTFIKKQKFDVMLYPAAARLLPSSFKTPGVAVINDVVSQYCAYADDDSSFFVSSHCLQKATKLIAASQYIRKDLIKLHINPDKIEVVHNGLDHSLFYPRTASDEESVLIKPFSIARPYLIYASRIHYPFKKHVELIRAFELFKKKTGAPHRLVLAGSDGRAAEVVHREVAASPVASEIFLTGYFPHHNLSELYASSAACIFPSVSEGVGLPVLEAMASGIPVACAHAGSLPELAGDHALYFDADDPASIADAIETIVSDSALRHRLISEGLDWTKRFSWQKTVDKTIAVLESVAR